MPDKKTVILSDSIVALSRIRGEMTMALDLDKLPSDKPREWRENIVLVKADLELEVFDTDTRRLNNLFNTITYLVAFSFTVASLAATTERLRLQVTELQKHQERLVEGRLLEQATELRKKHHYITIDQAELRFTNYLIAQQDEVTGNAVAKIDLSGNQARFLHYLYNLQLVHGIRVEDFVQPKMVSDPHAEGLYLEYQDKFGEEAYEGAQNDLKVSRKGLDLFICTELLNRHTLVKDYPYYD